MENFITPIKQNYFPTYNSNTHREGDWICVLCNNLNFSFRKKCNRCKTQTRQQNDLQPLYHYYYYMEPQFQQNQNINLQDQRQPLAQHCINITIVSSTPKKEISKLHSFVNKNGELPSVSPLLKKYRASKTDSTIEYSGTTQKKSKGILLSSLNHENQPFWRALDFDAPIQKNMTRDFESIYERSVIIDVQNQENYSQQQDNQELQKMVGSIIL